MSRVARKRYFGVHAPDSPACVHIDTETNTSLLIFRLRIFKDFSISAGKFCVKNWYRFFTFVKIEYQFFTSEKKSNQSFADDTNTYQFFTPKIIEIDHTQISHFPKVTFWYQFFTRCEICEMWNLWFNKAPTFYLRTEKKSVQSFRTFTEPKSFVSTHILIVL